MAGIERPAIAAFWPTVKGVCIVLVVMMHAVLNAGEAMGGDARQLAAAPSRISGLVSAGAATMRSVATRVRRPPSSRMIASVIASSCARSRTGAWSRAGARAQAARGGTRVGVRVPRSALRPGDLLVRLRLRTPGAPDEDAGSFLLRVLAD